MRGRRRWIVLLLFLPFLTARAAPGRSTGGRLWTWPEPIQAGACGADSVSVELRPDGTGVHHSVTWTTSAHSGDHWSWSIEGLDARKVRIWVTPYRRGPRMNGGNPPPRFVFDYDFAYPATQYDRTVYLRLRFRC